MIAKQTRSTKKSNNMTRLTASLADNYKTIIADLGEDK
jgi:hypothetical protein